MTKEMEKRLMREKRLIDIFQEQQEQKPFAFAYENLNAALQIFLANDRIAPKTVIKRIYFSFHSFFVSLYCNCSFSRRYH